jgi:Helix-turn-helix domain
VTTRERTRRDAQIVAMSDAGVPVSKVAERFDLTRRQVARIVRARRQEREASHAGAGDLRSARELLDELEALHVEAIERVKALGGPLQGLSLEIGRITTWHRNRAALEQLLDEAMAARTGTGLEEPPCS